MDAATRRALIESYRQGPAEVRAAVAGATDAELDTRPAPDEWTAREVVHHLADSETMSSIRLRKLLAEDAPTIHAYDEVEWAQRLHYDRPIERSLATLEAVRAGNAELLEQLALGQWSREGTHTESGPYGVETWLSIYAAHAHDHADQIRRARAAAGRAARALQ
jgi:hypothetical protein